MFGAGPTGLVLSQMLRQNGGCHVVVAAPQGLKMELAKKLGAGDVRLSLNCFAQSVSTIPLSNLFALSLC